MTTREVDREPKTPNDHRVNAVMRKIGQLIESELGDEYGGAIVFVKLGGPEGDPPHEFFVASPMPDELVIWTLGQAYDQCKVSLGS